MCSATIDQIRLRRATTLPVAFQNVSSSGFQSEIQVGLLRIGKTSFLNRTHRRTPLSAKGRTPGKPPVRRSHDSDDDFDRRRRWRQRETIQASCQPDMAQITYVLS